MHLRPKSISLLKIFITCSGICISSQSSLVRVFWRAQSLPRSGGYLRSFLCNIAAFTSGTHRPIKGSLKITCSLYLMVWEGDTSSGFSAVVEVSLLSDSLVTPSVLACDDGKASLMFARADFVDLFVLGFWRGSCWRFVLATP
jgi:hypothetical protein